LTFVKLGEEAVVDLAGFCLDGSRGKPFRHALRHLENHGATCRRDRREQVPAVVDDLRAVSNDWLEHKAGGEKGFSLGFFRADYVSRFPVAVVERDGRIVAFANMCLAGKLELSVD
jgi:phosphatidylglycerol lysyltransferase